MLCTISILGVESVSDYILCMLKKRLELRTITMMVQRLSAITAEGKT